MTAVPQPGVPYAKVWIAGVEVTESKDRRLMSFEYTLVTGKTPTMTVALLDLEFDYVESLVRQSGIDGMYFEFGWLGSSNNQLWSERIRASAQKYSPQIFDSYSIITIHSIVTLSPKVVEQGTNPQKDTARQQCLSYKDATKLSEFLKYRYSLLGFNTDKIEDTDDVAKIHCSTKDTLADHPPWLITCQTDLQAFHNDLKFKGLKQNTSDGLVKESGGTVGGGSKANGLGQIFFIPGKTPEVGLTFDNSPGPIVGAYVYPEPPYADRQVLGLSIEQSFNAFSSQSTHSGVSAGSDIMTGTQERVRKSPKSTDPGARGTIERDPEIQDGVNSGAWMGGSRRTAVLSSQHLRDTTVATYDDKQGQIRRASIILVGRVDFKFADHIMIYVYKRSGHQAAGGGGGQGGLYYLSGEWIIREIHHKILPGTFQTTLDLQRFNPGGVTHQTGGRLPEYVTGGGGSEGGGSSGEVKFCLGLDASIPNNYDPDACYWKKGTANA